MLALPNRSTSAHKGQCGRIAVIAGSLPMLGAAVLTSRAVLRSGAGLVTLFTVPQAQGTVNVTYPEIMVQALPSQGGFISTRHSQQVLDLLLASKADVIAIGPGLGRKTDTMTWVRAFIERALDKTDLPIVIDADALHAIDTDLIDFADPNRLVLTPHQGEFEHLFEKTLTDDPVWREEQLRLVCRRQVVVLKGHRTLIGFEDQVIENETGNPGMATAGSGDVLTGIIASYIGQGLSLFDAATLAVQQHGRAGDIAFDKYGNGLIASDIISFLQT